MDYFVYENWTHRRARIHRAECGYCNAGAGTQGDTSGRNGRWHGPMDRSAAFTLAADLPRVEAQPCGHCDP